MSTHNFEFEDFSDNFNMEGEISTEWPTLAVEMDLRWHPAEPDVGIFSSQPECTGIVYLLDGEPFTDEDTFAAAVYERIGDEIEETVEAVTKVIRDQVFKWEQEAEE